MQRFTRAFSNFRIQHTNRSTIIGRIGRDAAAPEADKKFIFFPVCTDQQVTVDGVKKIEGSWHSVYWTANETNMRLMDLLKKNAIVMVEGFSNIYPDGKHKITAREVKVLQTPRRDEAQVEAEIPESQ